MLVGHSSTYVVKFKLFQTFRNIILPPFYFVQWCYFWRDTPIGLLTSQPNLFQPSRTIRHYQPFNFHHIQLVRNIEKDDHVGSEYLCLHYVSSALRRIASPF